MVRLLAGSCSVNVHRACLLRRGAISVYPRVPAEVGTNFFSLRITFIFFRCLYDRQGAGQMWKGGKLTNQKAATC